jgi:TRAP-type mannitol/chloroaromatic compound transport system permease large subunit
VVKLYAATIVPGVLLTGLYMVHVITCVAITPKLTPKLPKVEVDSTWVKVVALPLPRNFGVDPLFFGVIVALTLQTSFLTPPMAMSAYHLKGVAPKFVLLWTIFQGCFPFLALVFVTMLLVYVFPQPVCWLPNVFYGN